MHSNNKGQAALEFLITYGWAFLVILIMIGALAYFGILSPSALLPERCNFPPEMSCRDFIITQVTEGSELNLDLSLTNVNDKSINIQSISVSTATPEVSDGGSCTVPGSSVPSNGEISTACTSITGSFPSAGSKQKLQVLIVYREVGGQFNHTVSGEVLGNIES